MSLIPRCRLPLVLLLLALVTVALASSGDRNPTFQHCLKGCDLTYCDPSQRPIAFYLRWFGWTCQDDCRYQCAHSFTDNIRQGSKWHQCERAPHFQVRIVLTLSLRQMAVLPPRPHPGAVLGAHVARQLLCQLAGAGRREATGAPGEQAEKVVAAGRVRPAQHLGLVLRLPLQG